MKNLRSFPLVALLLAVVFVALPGCKINIKAPHGGTIKSTDGAYTCESGQKCTIDVVDFFFDETFIAEADEGYYFSHWNKLDGFLCGGVTGPCRLSTVGQESNSALQDMLESDKTFYLQAVFVKKLDCPEPELVVSPGLSVR